MKRKLLFFVVVISLVLLFFSCSEKKTTEPDITFEPIITPETVVMEEDVAATIIEVTDEQIILPEGVNPEFYEPGNVIVSGPSEQAPYGLLRKVTDSYEQDGQIVVNTVQATLEDVFDELEFSISRSLKTSDIEKTVLLVDGVEFLEDDKDLLSFPHDINKNINLGSGIMMNVSGNVTLTFNIFFDARINIWQGLHYLEAGAILTQNLNIDFTVNGGFDYSQEIDLVQHYFTPITFFAGVIPIVIVPKAVIVLEIGANGDAAVTVNVNTTGSYIKAGAKYIKPHVPEPIFEPQLVFDQTTHPNLGTSLNIFCGSGPRFEMNLYGVAGPNVKALGFIELEADTTANPWWTLVGGFQLFVGLKFEVLGYNIANYTSNNLLPDLKFPIYQATESPPVATPTFNPPGGTYANPQTVVISCTTPNATILYSTDGSEPSVVYTTPVNIEQNTMLKARASKSGHEDSAIASSIYYIGAVATPTFDPPGGTYNNPRSVRIYCDTAGAAIMYTIDGSEPTQYSLPYYPFLPPYLTSNTTLKAKAFKHGLDPSETAEADYIFQVADPVFNPPGGIYHNYQQVTITCATQGAT
ncbi:MAG: chitobiase/beta-hexosaminidase C-terminal domain-containing protein, partial [Candidatus Cloacimonetes bacterium]|nr:chitobiase/beta-hexosaminidase C-terminal domain-containing protein [Candidatus Cloacimonadota bacterium]